MGWSEDAEVGIEVRRLRDRVPPHLHGKLERVLLQRASRLYGDNTAALAQELRLVRACIPKDEPDFETLLEGAFVEVPEGFTYEPRFAEGDLDSKMCSPSLSKYAYGVHAVNMAELEQYFRHGGVIPHYRDGKWRIEVTPYPRCYTTDRRVRIGNASKLYIYNKRYADQHGFTGYLVAKGVIKRTRDDHFGRQHLDQADELYKAGVKQFLENDCMRSSTLKKLLVSVMGAERGSALFREAIGIRGIRIEFSKCIERYFVRSETNMGAYEGQSVQSVDVGAAPGGSIVLDCNRVLPFDAVHSINFNGGREQARAFHKLLRESHPPKSIFRMYL